MKSCWPVCSAAFETSDGFNSTGFISLAAAFLRSQSFSTFEIWVNWILFVLYQWISNISQWQQVHVIVYLQHFWGYNIIFQVDEIVCTCLLSVTCCTTWVGETLRNFLEMPNADSVRLPHDNLVRFLSSEIYNMDEIRIDMVSYVGFY